MKPVPSTADEVHDILEEVGLDVSGVKLSEIDKRIDDFIKAKGNDGTLTLKL